MSVVTEFEEDSFGAALDWEGEAKKNGTCDLLLSVKLFWDEVKRDAPDQLPKAQKLWYIVASHFKGMRDWLGTEWKWINFVTLAVWYSNSDLVDQLDHDARPKALTKEIRRYRMHEVSSDETRQDVVIQSGHRPPSPPPPPGPITITEDVDRLRRSRDLLFDIYNLMKRACTTIMQSES